MTSETPHPTTGEQPGTQEALPVQFRYEWCKKCGICVAYCPRNALSMGARDLPFLSDVAACTQCKLCELMCPDFAVTVLPRQRGQAAGREGDKA